MSDTPTQAAALPELPRANHSMHALTGYTADQMRAYAQQALQEACAEIERQQATIIEMGGALRSVVNAIKGAPGPDAAHSTHDAADLVRQACAERDALRLQEQVLRAGIANLAGVLGIIDTGAIDHARKEGA